MSPDARFTHAPGTVYRAATVVAAVAAAGLVAPRSVLALAAGIVGIAGVVAGLVRSERREIAFGAIALLAGVVAAGAANASPVALLPATAAGVLAWEFGASAITAENELQGGHVERAEVLDVAAATGVGVLAAGVAIGVSQGLAFEASPLGLALLLVAAIALGVALRE